MNEGLVNDIAKWVSLETHIDWVGVVTGLVGQCEALQQQLEEVSRKHWDAIDEDENRIYDLECRVMYLERGIRDFIEFVVAQIPEDVRQKVEALRAEGEELLAIRTLWKEGKVHIRAARLTVEHWPSRWDDVR